MTACLAECRAYSRNDVAVDSSTESQVAAPDSSAYPKAVPPGNARASGVNKFFEKIKPLSDFVGAILDAAGSRISKLLGFDKIFNFGNLFNYVDCEIKATVQNKVGSRSVEQYSPSPEIPYSLLNGKATCSSTVWNSQGSNFQEEWEGTVFEARLSDQDWAKVIGDRESSFLAPEET